MFLTKNPELEISTLIRAINVDIDLIRKRANQTMQVLEVEKGLLIALNQVTMRLIEIIEELPSAENGGSLLFGDDIRKSMERAEKKLAALIRDYQRRKESAVSDSELHGADEAGVLSGYERSIDCAQMLAQSLQALRWAAMEYDADTSPILGKGYTDVKKLIADMQA